MSSTFVETERLIVLIDLAGFAKIFQTRTDIEVATWLQAFYTACDEGITRHGGTVIKFMGDACLSVFAKEGAVAAVTAVRELQVAVEALAREHRMSVSSLGANLHVATIVEGDFGGASRRGRDIIGRGVNQTFMLGHGAGVRISEPVYRALPSSARSPWRKHKPPAIYHLDQTAGFAGRRRQGRRHQYRALVAHACSGARCRSHRGPAVRRTRRYRAIASPRPMSSSVRRKRALSGCRR